MGGCSIENGSDVTSDLTIVLVGKTGNGKSATGNSIIGSKLFESKRSSSGVTTFCEMNSTLLKDGRTLNVIDTPGLFDSSIDPEIIGREIVRCIDMAKDGIHAVLVVYSVCSRFTYEEKAVVSCLQTLFGTKIFDYMIVLFTGGDELEADEKSLEVFVRDSPDTLKEVLHLCGNRLVLFDNRTKDEAKKATQVQKLISLVNTVLEQNCYVPYTNEMFEELKKYSKEIQEEMKCLMNETNKHLTLQEVAALMDQMHEKQLKMFFELFASKFIEIQVKLEKLLDEERAARKKAEENGKKERKKYEDFKKSKEEQKKKEQEKKENDWWRWCVMM